jgi:LacI family transcriptional regulator
VFVAVAVEIRRDPVAATIQEVAKRAGVSSITVSRVINGNAPVHPKTEKRVQDAIRELNYIPNRIARGLKSRKTATIALLVPDITNAFWTTVARGVEDAAEAAGYSVFLCNTDEEAAKEERYIHTILSQQVDGLLIGPTADSALGLQRLEARGLPFVLLDRTVEGVDADVVRADSEDGAYRMTAHLLSTGYSRVVWIGGPQATSTGRDRLAGYKRALQQAGVPVEPGFIYEGAYRTETGYESTHRVLRQEPRPEAIFAGNHLIMTGVLQALAEALVRVPGEIAVCSFDDIPGLNSFSPFLTAVVQPAYAIGELGARRLIEHMRGDRTETADVILPTHLEIRTSCGCAEQQGCRG